MPYATMPSSNAYNAAGQLLKFTYGNNVVANFGYSSARLQMTSLAYTNACPSPKLKTALNSHFDLLFFDRDPANCKAGGGINAVCAHQREELPVQKPNE
jgi:hypothetical protein